MKQKIEAVNYWKSAQKGKRKFSSVKANFRFLTNESQLYRFEKQIQNYGTRKDKLKIIWDHILDEFKNAMQKKLPVHDNDIRRWAISKARTLEFNSFTASKFWLWKFKSTNRIRSRKINKFVTSNYLQEDDHIIGVAKLFVDSSKVLPNYQSSHIFNTDQSGFNYELHSTRTLSFIGEKSVESTVRSVHATTHSYTIQPTITLEGKLLSPLFICLQEVGGSFGPLVAQNLFQCPNIVVNCSSSGKMTKNLVKIWCKDALIPSVKEKCLLLLDSWSGHSDHQMIQELFPTGASCEILKIPPKTTSLIQALDVYFFRQWKIFAKNVYIRVILDSLDVDLKDRNNIIKLHSLIHDQLSSPRFGKMIKYSWYKSRYLSEHPGKFDNVNKIYFNLNEQTCYQDCSQCSEGIFINCSWCTKPLCFTHFFIDYHFCHTFEG